MNRERAPIPGANETTVTVHRHGMTLTGPERTLAVPLSERARLDLVRALDPALTLTPSGAPPETIWIVSHIGHLWVGVRHAGVWTLLPISDPSLPKRRSGDDGVSLRGRLIRPASPIPSKHYPDDEIAYLVRITGVGLGVATMLSSRDANRIMNLADCRSVPAGASIETVDALIPSGGMGRWPSDRDLPGARGA